MNKYLSFKGLKRYKKVKWVSEEHTPTEGHLNLFSDHIDYIKNLIGVDFVAIGADYDGVPT